MIKRINANARFVYKSKSAAEWQQENPVLLNGEIGFVSDVNTENFVKVGDGVTPWNELAFKNSIETEGLKKIFATQEELRNVSQIVSNCEYGANMACGIAQDALAKNENKLNKIHIDDINQKADVTKHAFDVFGTNPCFYANIYDDNNGNPYQHENILVRGSQKAVPSTVAVRDSNGSVVVQVADTDPNTGESFKGSAVPHTFVNNIKNHLINDWIKPKKIISNYLTGTGLVQQFAESEMFILMHSSGENNIKLVSYKKTDDTEKTAQAIDAEGNPIPMFKAGLLIIPKGVTQADGGTDWYQKRGLLLAITGESLIGIPEFAVKQFYFWRNDCPPNFTDKTAPTGKDPNGVSFNAGLMFAENTTGALSVWKIKL